MDDAEETLKIAFDAMGNIAVENPAYTDLVSKIKTLEILLKNKAIKEGNL